MSLICQTGVTSLRGALVPMSGKFRDSASQTKKGSASPHKVITFTTIDHAGRSMQSKRWGSYRKPPAAVLQVLATQLSAGGHARYHDHIVRLGSCPSSFTRLVKVWPPAEGSTSALGQFLFQRRAWTVAAGLINFQRVRPGLSGRHTHLG